MAKIPVIVKARADRCILLMQPRAFSVPMVLFELAIILLLVPHWGFSTRALIRFVPASLAMPPPTRVPSMKG